MIAFLLLAGLAVADQDDAVTRSRQVQIDSLVHVCRAENYASLEALSSKRVTVHFLEPERITPESEQAFGCLLNRLKAIRGLVEFGVLVNEAELETEKN